MKDKIEDSCAVSEEIENQMNAHPDMIQDQAIAIAHEKYSGEKKDGWFVNEVEYDSVNKLNNVIKLPVILAREMVQSYRIKDGRENHFKPYDELSKGITNLEELPIIIEHKRFVDNDIVGYVREFRTDDNDRSIKGVAYLTESKLPDPIKAMLDSNQIVPVSIGFFADIERSNGEHLGERYDAVQRNFTLNHLAICIHSTARCPPGQCGINLDSTDSEENEEFTVIKKDSQYYNINDLKIDREENENNKSNSKKGEKVLETDSMAKTQSDWQKLLGKLDKYLKVATHLSDKKQRKDAQDFILSFIKPSDKKKDKDKEEKKMEDAEYEELIIALESELKELGDTLDSKQKVIDSYEAEKKKELIEKIKKFSVYEDSELEDHCMRDLEIIKDAVLRFEPSTKKSPKLARGTQKKQDSSDEPRLRGDSVFEETNKEFAL